MFLVTQQKEWWLWSESHEAYKKVTVGQDLKNEFNRLRKYGHSPAHLRQWNSMKSEQWIRAIIVKWNITASEWREWNVKKAEAEGEVAKNKLCSILIWHAKQCEFYPVTVVLIFNECQNQAGSVRPWNSSYDEEEGDNWKGLLKCWQGFLVLGRGYMDIHFVIICTACFLFSVLFLMCVILLNCKTVVCFVWF